MCTRPSQPASRSPQNTKPAALRHWRERTDIAQEDFRDLSVLMQSKQSAHGPAVGAAVTW